MSTTSRLHSPPTPPPRSTSPPAKRQRLQEDDGAVASSSAVQLPYGDGLHLAPMVRIGTLPMRLLSLEYGATLVWGPEIVDKAIIGCTREVDPISGVIRYTKAGRPIWETHPIERSRLIFQLGSADPELAVQAAKIVEQDVAGVGLNCGCPKSFSIQGGMGAALLSEPEKLCSILSALSSSLTVPVDAKIRLLPEQAPTLELVEKVIVTGISALTVHCRTKDMRSSEKALLERLREVVDLVREKKGKDGREIPVIANGDCFGVQDRKRIEDLTGVSAIMIARGAEANPSCFRARSLASLPVALSTESTTTAIPSAPSSDPTATASQMKAATAALEPLLADPMTEVIPLLLRLSLATGNAFGNTKYIINSMNLAAVPPEFSKRGKGERNECKGRMNRAKTFEEALMAFGVGVEVVQEAREMGVSELVPGWEARRKFIEGEGRAQGEQSVE